MDFNDSGFLRLSPNGIILACKIKANAKLNKILGIFKEETKCYLKLQIKAQALEGKANKEIISFLAKIFSFPKSQIEIKQGDLSSYKQILIKTTDELHIKTILLEYLQNE